MYGKIIGAMIGGVAAAILGWPLWAVLALMVAGALAGHLAVDRDPGVRGRHKPPTPEARASPPPRPAPAKRPAAKAPQRPPQEGTAEQKELARRLSPLFIEVARADGAVAQEEIRVAREFFEHTLAFGEAALEEVRVALKEALDGPPPELEALVKAARGEVKPTARLDVVRALYDCALVDGSLARSEADTLRRIVQHFNLSDEQLQQITTQYFGGGKPQLAILGLTAEASDDDIRSAFRKLAAESHPDRAASLGHEEAEAAAERFRALKDAYEELRKIRGF